MLPNRKRFRSTGNYLLACGSELSAPLLRTMAAARTSGSATPPERWRRGVILGADHIGDILYNTSSLAHLREGLPNCEWQFVADPPANEILLGNPYLSRVITRAEFRAVPTGTYDVALCYNSGMNWRDLVLAASRGIPNCIGYSDKGFSGLITFPISVRFPQPYPAYFRDLVGQLIGRQGDWSLRPRIYPTAVQESNALRIWQESVTDINKPVIACFASSRQPSGVWPAEKVVEILALLEAQLDGPAVLCGTAADRAMLEELKNRFQLRASIVAGKLDLLSLGCFLRRCAVVLCPDSGPRHIANAVGTPVVFVRNLAVRKIETGAYCETEIDVAPELECIPPDKQANAFGLIKPEIVAERVRACLSGEQRTRCP